MIGEMKEQVTLLLRQGTPDGGGGEAIVWEEGDTVAANAVDLASSAARIAGRARVLRRRRFTLRRRDDITAETRLAHRGLVFRLRALRTRADAAGFLLLDGEEVR